MSDDLYRQGYQQGYEQGFADGHAEGFSRGSLAAHGYDDMAAGRRVAIPGDGVTPDVSFDQLNAIDGKGNPEGVIRALRNALLDLENENARLIASLRGYVLAGSAKGPGVLKSRATTSARGVSRWAYKPRWRHPFMVGEDGFSWKRVKGRLRVEDWATKLPPKACAVCQRLFISARRDAKTCSTACRVALHRMKRKTAPHP
jgi:hypothetical protein